MNETVVHVNTLEQWKSVLDVWFEQGYRWRGIERSRDYKIELFVDGSYQICLNFEDDNSISYWSNNDYSGDNLIEYADFMAQQEKKMTTYEVTQEQLDLIEELTAKSSPVDALLTGTLGGWGKLAKMNQLLQRPILRYIGGDETIEFWVKEHLYRLVREDNISDTVYMIINKYGTPDWSDTKNDAFKAPLEEIKKWKTPAWEIERAD